MYLFLIQPFVSRLFSHKVLYIYAILPTIAFVINQETKYWLDIKIIWRPQVEFKKYPMLTFMF